MNISSFRSDDGYGFHIKGHVDLPEFMQAVKKEVDADDPILSESPVHCWMRVCRDFSTETQILVEAAPNSRGAFKCTFVQLL